VARREAQYLRDRARTIARTETIRAAQQGQMAAWREAADRGILERDRTFRVWQTVGSAACDICAPMNGERAALDTPFSNGLMEAHAHPNCRCTMSLVFTEEKSRIAKPLGRYADWGACVSDMARRLGSREAAERYCGKLESLIRG
jgi:hypothetical protein